MHSRRENMAQVKVTYKEPKNYFNADMMKAAKEFDKKKAAESNNKKTKSTGKKK